MRRCSECPRPRPGRLRRRGEGGGGQGGAAARRVPAEWGGQFENQQRASARLAIVVPIALVHDLPAAVLHLQFGAAGHAGILQCSLRGDRRRDRADLSGEFLSVPASVGFIALIGIAVLNGVVLVSYINRLNAEAGLSLHDAVREGARRRMTPVTLTATIAAFGLVPFLFADGPGAEIQRPLAIVVISGLVSATILTLVLLPILYDRFALPRAAVMADASAGPAADPRPAAAE